VAATKGVACPEPPAAKLAADVFERGGGVLEALIAAAFGQAVSNPIGCGIGGAAFILSLQPGWSEPRYFNALAATGSRATPAVWENNFAGRSGERIGRYLVRGDPNMLGYGAIMTPGFVRGMEALAHLGGVRSRWADLVGAAAPIARTGIPVYPYLETYYTFEGPDRLGFPDVFRKLAGDANARSRYLPGGQPPRTGSRLPLPEYAETLERLAAGPDEFYRGRLAQDMADDFRAHDGFVTIDDLASYEVFEQRPLRGTFRDLTLFTSPPSGHGVVLLAMLNLVEDLDLREMEWNGPDYIECIAWATRSAFGACLPFLGDPRFVTVPVQWLGAKERGQAARADAPAGWARSPDTHTTHVTAADSSGTMLSVTHSIGSVAGAGVMTPGLGFLYNNFMGQFNPLRGHHDSIAPGKRMGGGCPSIVYRGGAPWFAIGSSGGSRLISAVFQTILNAAVFGMSLQDAVAAPRVHCEIGRLISMEPAFDQSVRDELGRREYEIELSEYMGCNQAVGVERGGVVAGSDPRGGQGVALA
jgi:gamma-glutamyltranspeptidase/glutathione hydrolase